MVGRVGVALYWGWTKRSCRGHVKVIWRSISIKLQQIAILCLQTWFMRELSIIYDCSWIIQGQAPFQKVSQVVLRYPRSTRVVIAPSDLPNFHLRINSLFISPFSRTKIECQKWPNIVVLNYALNCNKFTYDCGKGNTGWSSTILRWCAKVIPRSYQGHIKVKLDKKYEKYRFMPSNFIYAWAKWYIYMTVVGSFRVKHYFRKSVSYVVLGW